jgi:hypothetical protein
MMQLDEDRYHRSGIPSEEPDDYAFLEALNWPCILAALGALTIAILGLWKAIELITLIPWCY